MCISGVVQMMEVTCLWIEKEWNNAEWHWSVGDKEYLFVMIGCIVFV